MTEKSKKKNTKDLPFEKALENLEDIVSSFEGGDLTLDESLKSFEKGMKLAQLCETKLNDASGKVEKILKNYSETEKTIDLDWDEDGEE